MGLVHAMQSNGPLHQVSTRGARAKVCHMRRQGLFIRTKSSSKKGIQHCPEVWQRGRQ